MDLAQFETTTRAEEGVWFFPVDFDKKPIDSSFLVLGQDAKSVRKAMAARAARAIAQAADNAGKDEVDQAELLADCVIDWKFVEWEGEALEFSRENAIKLFRACPFIADQIDRFLSRRRNFTRPALQTSEAQCGLDSSSPSPKSETSPE